MFLLFFFRIGYWPLFMGERLDSSTPPPPPGGMLVDAPDSEASEGGGRVGMPQNR